MSVDAQAAEPRSTVGIAVSTIGRPALHRMLDSLAASTSPPVAVAIADQSRGGLTLDPAGYPFPVTVVRSGGGLSTGRNDALAALPAEVALVGFPNDDSVYPPDTLAAMARRFDDPRGPVAISCAGGGTPTNVGTLPPPGTPLDRTTVWRAIEWTTFWRRDAVVAAGGFDPGLGTGCATPWQSGEGTDLLLRLLAGGGVLLSASDLVVLGAGERRDLDTTQFVAKNRRYARGTGFVYRRHGYPAAVKLKLLLGAWLRFGSYRGGLLTRLRIATARFVGRVEGLAGRTLG